MSNTQQSPDPIPAEINIQEGNRLIAEFAGRSFTGCSITDFSKDKPLPSYIQAKLKYHASWDQLKPVIYKIFTYAIALPDQVQPVREMKIVVDIIPAWQACVKFIQWYNQNNKP